MKSKANIESIIERLKKQYNENQNIIELELRHEKKSLISENKRLQKQIKDYTSLLILFEWYDLIDKHFVENQINILKKIILKLECEKYPFPDKFDKKGRLIDQTKSERLKYQKRISVLNLLY